jgi:NADPH2:quinone reductase
MFLQHLNKQLLRCPYQHSFHSFSSSYLRRSFSQMMRVIEIPKTGDSSVLELVERPIPTGVTSPKDILVKNQYAGVNYIDTYHRTGIYPLRSKVIGMEGAGEVVAVGDAVTSHKVGDLVAWPATTGSYSEYVVVPGDRAVSVPKNITTEVACAAMLQGMTAHYLVASTYAVKKGDFALVHAGAGGVGSLLVQMVKSRGGIVISTCGTEEKAELVRSLGADHVLVGYNDFAAKCKEFTGGKGVHVVYDGIGKDTFTQSLDCLRPRGMMVLYGGASGQVPAFDLQGLNSRGSLFVTRPKLGDYIASDEEFQWRAKEIFEEIVSGKVHYHIGKVYPIEHVKEAHDDLEGRKTTGKLLLKF